MSLYPPGKRLVDLTLALVGLILAAPLLAVLAVVVKLDSRGSIFFGHERVGRYRRPFKVWKIRTMVSGAHRAGAELTAKGDPRITRVGRVLRRHKLDEIPQLWNVLRGEMSFVGPRPEVDRYVRLFPSEYDSLLRIRPGITDWASLAYLDEEEILANAEDPEGDYVNQILPQKLALNLEYLEKRSMSEDMKIIANTLLRVLRR